MESPKIDFWTYLLVGTFLLLLAYAGYLSYKSIDWTILNRLESQTLVLPTQVIASPSAQIATPTATH
jgi:hypothetical protein